MCGIIGYIGKETEINLIEGLEKLEYRGYDSAGLCVLRNSQEGTESLELHQDHIIDQSGGNGKDKQIHFFDPPFPFRFA